MAEKWDYKTVNPSKSYAGVEILAEDPESELNNLGDKGWELVSTTEEKYRKDQVSGFSSVPSNAPESAFCERVLTIVGEKLSQIRYVCSS